MKCKGKLTVVAATILTISSLPALGELNVGDAAPPLSIVEWVKGDEFDLAKDMKRQFHVVEFWATWCGPCIQAMPHLSALQAEYEGRGVTIIGINIREMVRESYNFV